MCVCVCVCVCVCILKLKFHLVTAAKTVKFKYAEGSPKTFPRTKSGGRRAGRESYL